MEEEGNADYGGMVQLSQQHVASCVKGLSGDWGWALNSAIVEEARIHDASCSHIEENSFFNKYFY